MPYTVTKSKREPVGAAMWAFLLWGNSVIDQATMTPTADKLFENRG